jgi:hypothetical protein
MGRKDTSREDPGRDYATLLGMGWTPDTLGEAVTIARDLLQDREYDAALTAVEGARSTLLTAGTREEDRAALEAVAFEVALSRADASRAIGAVTALRELPGGLPQNEVARLLAELARSTVFRAELKEALERVLDAVQASSSDRLGASEDERSHGFGFEAGDDELPYLEADPSALDAVASLHEPAADQLAGANAEVPASASGVDEGLEWLLLTEDESAEPAWTPGAFVVGEGEDLGGVRARFLGAASKSGPDHGPEACEMAWSFFLMEDFEAAALLFDQALGDPAVRVSAAEGLVRCRLNLSQAGEAVTLLERLQSLCYADGLPEPLRYWYGRAAEARGDVRKARAAYLSLPGDAFPDVRGRLGALP